MILDEIINFTQTRVESLKIKKSLSELRTVAEQLPKGDFCFERGLLSSRLQLIAEVKQASPSKGIISNDFMPLATAKAYETVGAAAISVLTEPKFFFGSDLYLQQIRRLVKLPLLRKDFIVDEYQIYESKLLGADAILLLANVLDPGQLREYLQLCEQLGLSALVENHNAAEIQKSLQAGARIVGINNRDLRDFSVDINNTCKLRSLVPKDKILVSESGIRTNHDITCLRAVGVNAVLIGETLMRSKDISSKVKELWRGVDD